jgi:hypothetical protein
MKLKSGINYRILCDYSVESVNKLKSGDIVEIDCVTEQVIYPGHRHSMVRIRNKFSVSLDIFKMIAEETD